MSGLFDDFRFTWRNLRTRLWANLASVILIAAALVVFVNAATLVRLIAGEQPATVPTQGLHAVSEGARAELPMLGTEMLALRDLDPAFAGMAAFRWTNFNLADQGTPELVMGLQVDGNPFELLGWSMLMGSGFKAADFAPGAAPTVVIAHRLWTTRYAADQSVIGRTVRIDGVPATIVGVLGERREFPFQHQVYRNISLREHAGLAARYWNTLIKIDGTAERERLTALVADVLARRTQSTPDQALRLLPYFGQTGREESITLTWTLQLLAALLILTAAANAGGLLWVQWLTRTGELATRAALGATASRQFRLVFVQAALIAGMAVLLGLPVGQLTMAALEQYLISTGNGMPPYFELKITPNVLLWVLAVMLMVVPVLAMPAILRLRSMGISAGLRQGSRSTTAGLSRTTRSFFALQIAVAAVTVCVVLIAVSGAQRALTRSMGFDDGAIVVGSFISQDVVAQERFARTLLARVREHPHVQAASVSYAVPRDGTVAASREIVDGDRRAMVGLFEIDPDYAQVFELSVLAGRWFVGDDAAADSRPAVIDRRVAEKWFTGDAVGRTMDLIVGGETLRHTVIGVVDAQGRELQYGILGAVYAPQRWRAGLMARISVRLRGPELADGFVSQLQQLARAVDSDIALADAQTWTNRRWIEAQSTRLILLLFAPLGLLALGLTALGTGALIGALIGMRRKELALRRALGAPSVRLSSAAVHGLLSFAVVGTVVGLLMGVVLGGQLASTVYGDEQLVAGAVILMPLVLGLAMLLASSMPLLRAARMDPALVLRHE